MSSEPSQQRCLRVGHKGAHAIEYGNTLASFDAALDVGVDMIEFDVLPGHHDGTGELFLAHDYEDLGSRTGATLEEGLVHLASERFAHIQLDIDLKLPNYEERVVDALKRHGLIDRTIISTMERSSLKLLRRTYPELQLGWSVPKLQRNPMASPFTAPLAVAMARSVKRALPARAALAFRAQAVDAIMAHWRLVSEQLIEVVHNHNGRLFVWTVDDLERIQRLIDLGVDGIITNDPRLFADLHGVRNILKHGMSS